MKRSIQTSENKILKLTNVLIQEIDMSQAEQLPQLIMKMENYLKTKGAIPIGPVIQKTGYNMLPNGQVEVSISIMRQSNNPVHSVNTPYRFESQVRVPNCYYARYIGPEQQLNFAYNKLNIIAFENEVDLVDDYYTVFVDMKDEYLVADVFAEKKSHE